MTSATRIPVRVTADSVDAGDLLVLQEGAVEVVRVWWYADTPAGPLRVDLTLDVLQDRWDPEGGPARTNYAAADLIDIIRVPQPSEV